MSLLSCYSFDDVANSTQLLQLGFTDISNSTIQTSLGPGPRTGTQHYNTAGSIGAGGRVAFPITAPTAREYGVISSGFYCRAGGALFLRVTNPAESVTHLQLGLDSSRHLQILNGAGTVLYTSTGAFAIDIWYWMEFKFRIHDSSGSVHVKVNGADFIALQSSIDTRNGGASGKWSAVEFGYGGSSTGWDDFHIAADDTGTDTFLGEGTKVFCQFPVNEGNYSAWTPSTGTDNSDLVDESAGPNTTDYVSSNTASQKDSYTHAALGVTGVVNMVEITTWALKDVSGDLRQYKNFMRVNGTDYQGTETATPSAGGLTALVDRWLLNPDTAAAWTVGQVDAMEPGIELTT